MHTTDVPLVAEERLREACLPEDRRRQVAGILAAGLLRLRIRPQVPAAADKPGQHDVPKESSESDRKPLACPHPRGLILTPVNAREKPEKVRIKV